MKLLIAEDDLFFRRVLEQTLTPDYDVVVAKDGSDAWKILQQPDAPKLAILDWVMPGLSGPQICRNVRESLCLESRYLIILTARDTACDIVSGLRAGADDYMTKPFQPEELRARVKLGRRIVDLEQTIAYNEMQVREGLEREKELHHYCCVKGDRRRKEATGRAFFGEEPSEPSS
jgi:DNA-binding response OmpR family regulator